MNYYTCVTGPIEVNTYIGFDEHTKEGFIVDPGGYLPQVTKLINKEAININYIIITHGHADHIGGVVGFKHDFPNAKVVALDKEREMLTDPIINLSVDVLGEPVSIIPDIFVKDGEHLRVGNMDLEFISTPGHTKGGMSIYTKGYLFSGDTLFRHSLGRTDFFGGDYNQIVKSIKNKLYLLPDDTIVLPGHDAATTIGLEKKENPFVRA